MLGLVELGLSWGFDNKLRLRCATSAYAEVRLMLLMVILWLSILLISRVLFGKLLLACSAN